MHIYHVAPEGHEGDLESLHMQHGDEAYEMYADRWPEAGELAVYHAHYVHCYSSKIDAEKHAASFGGKVYTIDADDLDVEIDDLEFPHPVVRDYIPASCLISHLS